MTENGKYSTVNVNEMFRMLKDLKDEAKLITDYSDTDVSFNNYSSYLNGISFHLEEDYSFPYRDDLKHYYDILNLIKFEEEIGTVSFIDDDDMSDTYLEKSQTYNVLVKSLYLLIENLLEKAERMAKYSKIVNG